MASDLVAHTDRGSMPHVGETWERTGRGARGVIVDVQTDRILVAEPAPGGAVHTWTAFAFPQEWRRVGWRMGEVRATVTYRDTKGREHHVALTNYNEAVALAAHFKGNVQFIPRGDADPRCRRATDG